MGNKNYDRRLFDMIQNFKNYTVSKPGTAFKDSQSDDNILKRFIKFDMQKR